MQFKDTNSAGTEEKRVVMGELYCS